MHISDDDFANLIATALDLLPEKYGANMKNVLITYADEPTPEQRHKFALRGDQTLFGLYEGIPLTERGAGYNLVFPDKITLFKFPLAEASANLEELQEHIRHTLWHEVAHHFGLGHDRIHELDRRRWANDATHHH